MSRSNDVASLGNETKTNDAMIPTLGRTLLHLAARSGDVDECRRQLALGAFVDARDDLGWTPLGMAAAKGHADVVGILLDHGADLDIVLPAENTYDQD
jgi:ankyrin repeat protein